MLPFLLLHYTDRVPRQWPVPSKYYNDTAVGAIVDSFYPHAHNACLTMVEKTDLFRYAIIYKRGGIYSDADTHIVRHPSKWPKGDAVIGVEFRSPLQLNQWTFAARRGSPILKHVISHIDSRLACDVGTVQKTGPVAWTKAIQDVCDLEGVGALDEPVDIECLGETIWILPYRAFSWPGWAQGAKPHPNLVTHDFRGSWKNPLKTRG